MQVGDVTKNGNFISKAYTSMKPLIWILKIFALNGNVDPTRSKSYVLIKSICTYSILASSSLYCLYFKIEYVYPRLDASIRLTDMIQVIADVCQYAVDLYFVYKYGRNMYVEYIKQYEKIDNFLDTRCYSALKRLLVKVMAFYTAFWTLSSLGDLGAWVITFGWLIPIVHGVSYIFLFIKMLTTLDLIAQISHVEARLRMISNFVQSCYSCTELCPIGQLTDCVRNKNWLYRDEDGAMPVSHKERAVDSFEIKRITKCYLLLTEQVMFINKMYGIRILLNTLNLLLDMVKILNLAIRIAVGTQRTLYHGDGYNYLPGISGMMRFLTCASILISLVYQCEQAYLQRGQVINVIDHLLINKNPAHCSLFANMGPSSTEKVPMRNASQKLHKVLDEEGTATRRSRLDSARTYVTKMIKQHRDTEDIRSTRHEDLRSAIVDLRTLLQDRPICFNMENFFTLNNSLLVSIASVVVTYTIILLQSAG